MSYLLTKMVFILHTNDMVGVYSTLWNSGIPN